MHFIMSVILVPQMNYLGFFLAREWFCVFTLLGNWTLIWIVLDQFWTLLLIRVKAEMYCWGCNAASFWLFCFSLFILKFVLYTLLILRSHISIYLSYQKAWIWHSHWSQSPNGVWNIFGGKLAWGPEAIVCDDPNFQGRGNPSSGMEV